MTILQALAARYDRLAPTGALPVPGFAPTTISFTLVLDEAGRYVTTHDEREMQGKTLRPRSFLVPAAPKRSSGIAAAPFWDKTSYVLGRTRPDGAASPAKQAKDADRLGKEHAAFVRRHLLLLDGVDDPACRALLLFLRDWSPDRYDALRYADEMLDANVAFRLQGDGGRFIHDRAAARAALDAEAAERDGGPRSMCLVTGTVAPIARLHPSIKGVAGAQTAGAALVSFNLEAFESYGKAQGANAPVSEATAFAYTTALNALLAPSGWTNPSKPQEKPRPIFPNRVMLGDTTTVFWAEHGGAAEHLARAVMGAADDDAPIPDEDAATDATETTSLRDVLARMQDGTPLSAATIPGFDPATRIFVLGLSPNAARLSVRFWVEQSLADFTAHFKQHWDDLRLDPAPRSGPPPLWRLLLELAPQRKAENIPSGLAGEVMRAVLTGAPYPRALLTQTIMRVRADRDVTDPATKRTLEKVSGLRVALLKACLARLRRSGQISEDVPVSLDETTTNTAYRLGRLFAAYEQLQWAALGDRNATIRDRFFSAASATPLLAFPSLMKNSTNHLKSVRTKSGPGRMRWFEDCIGDITSGLTFPLPTTLPLEEQATFVLGYYHQRDALRRRKEVQPTPDPDEPGTDDVNGDEP